MCVLIHIYILKIFSYAHSAGFAVNFAGLPGVLSARAGYTGGKAIFPTYLTMWDHTEAIQVDPKQTCTVSYPLMPRICHSS